MRTIRVSAQLALVAAAVMAVSSTGLSNPPVPANIPVTPVTGGTTGLTGVQNEEQVWICPNDTSVIIANHRDFRLGYRQVGLGRSIDGGASWVDTLIDTSYQVFAQQSDPVMTVTSSGRIVLCHLDFASTAVLNDSSHLSFLTSDDCGLTWQGPYTVVDTIGPYFEDKQFIVSDRTGGIYDGSVYISWTRYSDGEPNRIMFAGSPDGGVTWGDTVVVGAPTFFDCLGGTQNAGQLTQPLVGADGAVYVFWLGFDVDTTGGGCALVRDIRFNKSTDGGATWAGESVATHASGVQFIEGGIAVYSQATTDADISGGPHSGNLYLQYRNSSDDPPFDSDIYCRRSLDNGLSWSEPQRVNDDAEGEDADQFHNWMICNDDGILVSIWYDQRTDDPNYYLFDAFAAYSFDGGQTWTSNHRISDVSIDPDKLEPTSAATSVNITSNDSRVAPNAPQAGLLAEYIGVSSIGDKIVAVWTDTRYDQQDVMSASWSLPVMDPRILRGAATDTLTCTDTLKWATSWKEDADMYEVRIADNPNLFPFLTVDSVFGNGFELPDSLPTGIELYWIVKAYHQVQTVSIDSSDYSFGSFVIPAGCTCLCEFQGDFDGNMVPDALDLNGLIDALFFGGPNPQDPSCPTTRGDFNADGVPDALDLNDLIDHLFFGGPGPTDPCM